MIYAESFRHLLRDLFNLPNAGRSVFHVWIRNFLYFRRTFMISAFWVVIEPLFYLLALGYGVGRFVGEMDGRPYAEFFAPALMTTTGLMVAYFESTYVSYTKYTRQKTYQTILLTPVTPAEIILGEIFWSASKGLFSAVAVGVVASGLNLIPFRWLIPALFVVAGICWIAAAFGMLMVSYARNFDWFAYAHSGFIIPISLFSGTYFPLSQLPEALRHVAHAFPLAHAVSAVRLMLDGRFEPAFFLHLASLVVFAFFLTNWAVSRMERKLLG